MKLNENFNEQEFSDWIEGFLPDFSLDIRKVDVPNGFIDINSIKTLGESVLGVRVYIIETNADPSKRKVGLAKDSFNLLKNYGSPNAIIAYHSIGAPMWRISLLTSTPIWNEGKIIIKLSNPKRQSYVLGSKAKIKTPHQYLISKGKVLDFFDLKSRFSLEVVNKEFYKEISARFTELVGGTRGEGRNKIIYDSLLKLPSITNHSQTSIEFAVRLIGRVIFCWFLKEKISSLGSPLMPKELLSLDAISKNPDYYHNILESIFFEILNKSIKSRKDPYSSEPFSLIPYLNGGLFSPHDDDFFSYNEGKQAINHNLVVIPDEWFIDFFKILETYNFTIDENTSIDEELSIDPEMLGRIFENLLAEINPETGESARKSTGSFYTPRTIVDYMIDESLLLYLNHQTNISDEQLRAIISYDLTDDTLYPVNNEEKKRLVDAIEKVKILDPACGSGAFPIGALQKIVFILQQIDPDGQIWFQKQIQHTSPEIKRVIEREFSHKNFDYIRKLGVIRENIYGIDIQPIATEISRLRCFLTLVVDERIDDSLENRGIEPLPNLDFKFVTANSLSSLPTSNEINQIGLFEDMEGIDELREIRDMFFNASGTEREQLKLQFMQIQKNMLHRLISENRRGHAALTTLLTTWDPFSHQASSWFDPEWMFGMKEGFDIVIANPPYIGFHGIKEIREQLTKDFKSAKGKFDLYLVFIEKGLQFLKDSQFMVYICPTNFMKRDHGMALRDLLSNTSKIIEVVDFGHKQMFDSVTNYTGIFLFQKSKATETHKIKYKNELATDSTIYYLQNKLNKKAWIFRSDDLNPLMEKLELHKKLSTLIDGLSEGIVTGLNKFYLLSQDNIAVNNFETKYFQKCIRGKEVKRNKVQESNFYVFYPYEDVNGKTKVVSEDVLELNSPNYYKFLLSNKEELLNRSYFKKSNKKWYELWNPRSLKIFNNNKIVTPELSASNNFAFANSEYFYGDTVCGITLKENSPLSLLSLLAILNSKLIEFFFKKTTVPKAGGFYIYKVMFLKDIPIAIPDESYASQLDKLQNQLFTQDNSNLVIEKEIDELVYKMYGLTNEEIRIVENAK